MSLVALLLASALAAALSDAATGAPPSCIACAGEGPARLRAVLGAEAWDRLRAGEVIVEVVRKEESEGGARGSVRAAIAIDAPPERVWRVLTDFESWPDFLPDVTSVAVERQDDRRVRLRQEASVLWSTVAYTTLRRLEPARGRITWKLDPSRPHDIESVSGSCQLVPLEERRVTLMEYRSRMDVGRALPDFVEGWLVERSLPAELRAVRAEVERHRER